MATKVSITSEQSYKHEEKTAPSKITSAVGALMKKSQSFFDISTVTRSGYKPLGDRTPIFFPTYGYSHTKFQLFKVETGQAKEKVQEGVFELPKSKKGSSITASGKIYGVELGGSKGVYVTLTENLGFLEITIEKGGEKKVFPMEEKPKTFFADESAVYLFYDHMFEVRCFEAKKTQRIACDFSLHSSLVQSTSQRASCAILEEKRIFVVDHLKSDQVQIIEIDLKNDRLTAVHTSESFVFLGTEQGTLLIYDLNSSSFLKGIFSEKKEDNFCCLGSEIFSLCSKGTPKERHFTLFVGSDQGLIRLEIRKKSIEVKETIEKGHIYALEKCNEGILYGKTLCEGVFFLENEKKKPTLIFRKSSSTEAIRKIAMSGKDLLVQAGSKLYKVS